jgi:hypothetical protein
MGVPKAIRKQAIAAERVATQAADTFVADEMKTLAEAFRAQANVLKKAREMSKTGCYDIHIVTPEGRDYHSSEFADLPRAPVAERPVQKGHTHPMAGPHPRFPR